VVADRGAQLLVAPQLADFLCEALTQVGTIQKHADLLLPAPQLADFLCEALTQVGTIQKHADLLLPITVQMQIDCFVDSAALLGGGMKS